MKPIPYGKQEIIDEDIKAVVDVLKSDFLTQGPKVEEFEKKFAAYIGSKYAVAVSNGTAALHLAALSLGVKKGSKVITSPISFVATANCIEYCGGEITFCDIDPETLCIDVKALRNILDKSPKGTYQGVIPIDFAGYPVQMDEIRSLANEYDLWILEDSCHAPGGYFIDNKGVNQNCGNGSFADAAIFSFHPVKHIACGEGGMVTTNDEKVYEKLKLLRSHGITKDSNKLCSNHGGWYYEMQNLGYNYRLPDIQCALGISQLKRATSNIEKRREIAKNYINNLNGLPISIPKSNYFDGHAFHLFVILTEKRFELYNYLRKNKILTQIHYIPIHQMPYYVRKYGEQKFVNSEFFYNECLSLPIYPGLNKESFSFIIKSITNFFKNR
ncbi:UDP-4-amino-4,6-dideoxy-N-acetyl-beta-L-altrosamine transaminase [Flavobacteriaceae bacterium]|nr:UDP-4-amino-4,6-dideoxy-N-acetyl-beta-L-altrosamine transaminase [Flavobacteriaceae bacterium]